MFRKIKIKNKNEIIALIFLLILTITATSYYNFTQKKIKNNYNEIINNIYFKKTVNHFLNICKFLNILIISLELEKIKKNPLK